MPEFPHCALELAKKTTISDIYVQTGANGIKEAD